MKCKYLNKILLDWDNSEDLLQDNNIINSSNIRNKIELKPEKFFDKLIEYRDIIDDILESKKIIGKKYNFLEPGLEIPWMLSEYSWQGKFFNDSDVDTDFPFLEMKDIFCDWVMSHNGGLSDKNDEEGWDVEPCFSFVIYINDMDTTSDLYKHYKKFERYLVENFKKKTLTIDDHLETGFDELYFFTVSMTTKCPKGNRYIIHEWFEDILQVCELYIKFIQFL